MLFKHFQWCFHIGGIQLESIKSILIVLMKDRIHEVQPKLFDAICIFIPEQKLDVLLQVKYSLNE